MTFEEYAKLEGLNWSVLKAMRRSPLHFRHALANQAEDTIRLGLGRAGHCAILTPDLFPVEFAVWGGGDRRGKAWDEFKAAHRGQTVIKLDEYADCIGMRDAVRSHPVAGPIIADQCETEKVITWTDPDTELPCKARLDYLGESLLMDLKTTADVDARRFGVTAERYGYHLQLAHYLAGLTVLGMQRPVKLLAVETAAPWDVAVFGLDEDLLWHAENDRKELMAKVAAGYFSGLWPGRHPVEEPLQLPAWAYPSDDDVMGLVFGAEEAA